MIAQSQADASKTATATVTLNPGAPSAIAIFNTGLAAEGAADPHYLLVTSADSGFPSPGARVTSSSGYPFPYWIANGPNSKWIAPQASQSTGNAPGAYTYRTTFDLTGFNPATATLTGQWAADDCAVMKLNGNVVNVSPAAAYNNWTPFTITSGFAAGVNTLDFVVTNGGPAINPTGLRVEISGTVR